MQQEVNIIYIITRVSLDEIMSGRGASISSPRVTGAKNIFQACYTSSMLVVLIFNAHKIENNFISSNINNLLAGGHLFLKIV